MYLALVYCNRSVGRWNFAGRSEYTKYLVAPSLADENEGDVWSLVPGK